MFPWRSSTIDWVFNPIAFVIVFLRSAPDWAVSDVRGEFKGWWRHQFQHVNDTITPSAERGSQATSLHCESIEPNENWPSGRNTQPNEVWPSGRNSQPNEAWPSGRNSPNENWPSGRNTQPNEAWWGGRTRSFWYRKPQQTRPNSGFAEYRVSGRSAPCRGNKWSTEAYGETWWDIIDTVCIERIANRPHSYLSNHIFRVAVSPDFTQIITNWSVPFFRHTVTRRINDFNDLILLVWDTL